MLRHVTRIVGLTGGIGSGKSSVAKRLAELGAVVVDADAIVHELQAPGQPLLAEIAALFGDEVIDSAGRLDRPKLAERVFRDPAQRARLNALVHPRVGAEMARRVQGARDAGAPVVVLDVPLLLEGRKSGAKADGGIAAAMGVEAVVVVWVPEAVQVERTVARDGCTREQALARIQAQMPLDEKRALADHVIDNSGTPEDTDRQVRALWATWRAAASADGPLRTAAKP